jgi:dienelactone hydrolase
MAGAILFGGCLHQGGLAGTGARPTASIPLPASYFAYLPDTAIPQVRGTTDAGDHTVTKLRFPTRPAYFYLPKTGRPAPAIIVLPITQGDFYSKALAEYLVDHGYACLRFQSQGELLRMRASTNMLQDFERMIREYVIDAQRGIDWLTAQPGVDPGRIAVSGISMGAIVGSVVIGVDRRVQAGAFVLGGGDLAGILFESTEKSIIRIRQRIQEQQSDMSDAALKAMVAEALRGVDPLSYAKRVDPRRVLLITAVFDEVIPQRFGDLLWRRMGKPELVRIPTGHYTAGLYFPYAELMIRTHIAEVFADRRLAPERRAGLTP